MGKQWGGGGDCRLAPELGITPQVGPRGQAQLLPEAGPGQGGGVLFLWARTGGAGRAGLLPGLSCTGSLPSPCPPSFLSRRHAPPEGSLCPPPPAACLLACLPASPARARAFLSSWCSPEAESAAGQGRSSPPPRVGGRKGSPGGQKQRAGGALPHLSPLGVWGGLHPSRSLRRLHSPFPGGSRGPWLTTDSPVLLQTDCD